MNGEPLPLMSATQRESYCVWLERIAGRKRGSLPEKLRSAAAQLRDQWSFA